MKYFIVMLLVSINCFANELGSSTAVTEGQGETSSDSNNHNFLWTCSKISTKECAKIAGKQFQNTK